MFARASAVLLCALAVFGATSVVAAPLYQHTARQIGDLQCNIDRLKIVGDIVAATATTNTLKSQLASDANGSTQIAAVSSGLGNVSSGIDTIAAALFTGQDAPAAARDQVAQGLTAAITAANSITSTNSQVTSNVNKLKTQLQAAESAGNGVVANCK
ncbi:hypothetical protein EUX98_g8755 [Antrodiella citrinella]|uniref:Uncharacterized protein n=1 Tax=Antrodiella citrinella TaxID=2447956 RepID=A0A4S4M3L3_9APHY|nr:hypothetical protein EUX98_g8755 [Antrodiella citrinella]